MRVAFDVTLFQSIDCTNSSLMQRSSTFKSGLFDVQWSYSKTIVEWDDDREILHHPATISSFFSSVVSPHARVTDKTLSIYSAWSTVPRSRRTKDITTPEHTLTQVMNCWGNRCLILIPTLTSASVRFAAHTRWFFALLMLSTSNIFSFEKDWRASTRMFSSVVVFFSDFRSN